MILVRVEAEKSINSAVVVKHKRKEISLRADICLRGRNFFLQILDKNFENWKEVIKVVALDEIKSILNTYEAPLKELRDSL